jgi:hypothetical protein
MDGRWATGKVKSGDLDNCIKFTPFEFHLAKFCQKRTKSDPHNKEHGDDETKNPTADITWM